MLLVDAFDIYTKALGPQSFKNICSKLGLINRLDFIKFAPNLWGVFKGYRYEIFKRKL